MTEAKTFVSVTIELDCKDCGKSLDSTVMDVFEGDRITVSAPICSTCSSEGKHEAWSDGYSDGVRDTQCECDR